MPDTGQREWRWLALTWGRRRVTLLLAGLLTACETLMDLCRASALSYRGCVNGQQGSVQKKYPSFAPHSEAGASLPPHAGVLLQPEGPGLSQSPCVLPKLVAAGHAWSSAAGVFTGRGRNRKNIFYFYFHSCWWEGCLRPIWREAGWPGEAAPGADTLPPSMDTVNAPAQSPSPASCFSSLQCCREHLALEDKIAYVGCSLRCLEPRRKQTALSSPCPVQSIILPQEPSQQFLYKSFSSIPQCAMEVG